MKKLCAAIIVIGAALLVFGTIGRGPMWAFLLGAWACVIGAVLWIAFWEADKRDESRKQAGDVSEASRGGMMRRLGVLMFTGGFVVVMCWQLVLPDATSPVNDAIALVGMVLVMAGVVVWLANPRQQTD